MYSMNTTTRKFETLCESVPYVNQSDTRKFKNFKNKNNTIWLVHEKCCQTWLANDRNGGTFCVRVHTFACFVFACFHLFVFMTGFWFMLQCFLVWFHLFFLLINLFFVWHVCKFTRLFVCLFVCFSTFTCFVFVFAWGVFICLFYYNILVACSMLYLLSPFALFAC